MKKYLLKFSQEIKNVDNDTSNVEGCRILTEEEYDMLKNNVDVEIVIDDCTRSELLYLIGGNGWNLNSVGDYLESCKITELTKEEVNTIEKLGLSDFGNHLYDAIVDIILDCAGD